MSEFKYIEKPFLEQLKALGWLAIDQGFGIPQDPTKSLRASFREVILRNEFKKAVKDINQLSDGRPWLTEKQLEDLCEEISNQPHKNLLEANKDVLRLIKSNTKADKNEITGEEFPIVRFIDFDNPEKNSFIAINQFRIDTPGTPKGFIIPDLVLFVNGLPLIVVECKDQNEYTANPMHEAIKQLRRYSNQREETLEAGLKEGEERLFHFNQILIATYGDDAKYGTISSSEEHFLNWKDIYPEELKNYTPPLGIERSQEKLIQGMLSKTNLLDIIQNFNIYMEVGNGKEAKVLCRYQQFRAVQKIIDRIEKGKTPIERSGVVFHTQGSGKSLSMVFLIRKLRQTIGLNDYKIILINDRIDLEDQLGETAKYTGEKVDFVNTSSELREKLSKEKSNITMVMMQKFQERDKKEVPDYFKEKLNIAAEPVPEFKTLGTINSSDRIIILIDESHRTVNGDLGDNVFAAFPNSTKIAFTGTPLITDRHKTKTVQRFGDYIDKYRLQDAVDDGTTVQILYEGKTADTALNEKSEFDRKFEDLFRERSEEEIAAIKKRYGTYGDVLEAEPRIEAIANDMVRHYIRNILPNNFKAQVVSSSKIAAVRYKKYIDLALKNFIAEKENDSSFDPELLKKVKFLKVAVMVSSDDTNEDAIITQSRKEAKENKAVDNFKEKFDYEKPLTGIAFLVVCDMLLTGFDAPIEQIMYIDKKLKEHSLLQAIARVNRVTTGKKRGYIVDYIGLANNLKDALSIYGGENYEELLSGFKDIASELPILENRYRRLLQLFSENKIERIEDFVNQKMKDKVEEYQLLEKAIDLLEDIKLRASFRTFYQTFIDSMDIILPNPAGDIYKIPVKRFGYLLNRVKERYKDNSLDIASAGNKVKRLINEHLISLGINPKLPPTELFSANFIQEVEKNQSARAKASEMEHAIRKHIKINLGDDPIFYKKLSEKLDAIIDAHKNDWELIFEELSALRTEADAGRKEGTIPGITKEEAPFYDLILDLSYGKDCDDKTKERLKPLVKAVMATIKDDIIITGFWNKGDEIERLKGEMLDVIYQQAGKNNLDPVIDKAEFIVTEVLALAKKRHNDIIGE